MRFNEIAIKQTVDKLINGKDYREEVINAINVEFFKKILSAKMNDTNINLDWYKNNFINNDE